MRPRRAAKQERLPEAGLEGVHSRRQALTRLSGRALGAAAVALISLAAASEAPARAPAGFFGVTPQAPLGAADFSRMQTARVGTLRFQLSWAAADPAPPTGDYDWSQADPVIGEAALHGIRALPFIYSTPPWVARLDGRGCQDGDCLPFAPRGPAALAAWGSFAAAAAARYGPGGEYWSSHPEIPAAPVRVWQVWNEQNSPTFYRPKPDVAAYARMLRVAHDALRARDPAARIVLGGMFGTPLGARRPALAAWRYLRQLYRVPGARRDFEGVGAHPYAGEVAKVKAQLNRLRRETTAAGDREAGLWVTELGWASGGPPGSLNRGLGGQAARLSETFGYLNRKRRKLKIENVDWYSWRDTPGMERAICEWCPKTGLVTEALGPKPSLRAFVRFTRGN